jgi:hypothetical protein
MNFLEKLRVRRRTIKGRKNEEFQWIRRDYESPSPQWIKHATLLRIGSKNAIWVETGTFLGETTALLAKDSKLVFTIEPERSLFEKAKLRFTGQPNIRVIHGLSENILPTLLPTLGGSINFWLDGHYSGGLTHQGPTDCPVREELSSIEKNLSLYDEVTVLIDDVRCFNPLILEYADYPDINFLVDWARKNHLVWHIEHDIFIAKSKKQSTHSDELWA